MIRYLYRETTEEEEREINKALLCDSELMALYDELRATLFELDEAEAEPSPTTVLSILAYSKSTQPKEA